VIVRFVDTGGIVDHQDWFMVFNATFNNISVLLVEENGEIHGPVASR